jgi:hypothetical protein
MEFRRVEIVVDLILKVKDIKSYEVQVESTREIQNVLLQHICTNILLNKSTESTKRGDHQCKVTITCKATQYK